MLRDFYKRLGVEPDGSPEQLKNAYRQKARELHPDGLVGAAESELADADKLMRELNEAWAVLGDPVKRAAYDLPQDESNQAREAVPTDEGWAADDVRAAVPLSTLAWRLLIGLLAIALLLVAASVMLELFVDESPSEVSVVVDGEIAEITSQDCVVLTVSDLILPVDCSEPNIGRPVEVVDQDHACSNSETLRIKFPDSSGRWLCVLPLEE